MFYVVILLACTVMSKILYNLCSILLIILDIKFYCVYALYFIFLIHCGRTVLDGVRLPSEWFHGAGSRYTVVTNIKILGLSLRLMNTCDVHGMN